jgi:hypothetical protein
MLLIEKKKSKYNEKNVKSKKYIIIYHFSIYIEYYIRYNTKI